VDFNVTMVSNSSCRLILSSQDLNFYPVSPEVFPRPAVDPTSKLNAVLAHLDIDTF
jgi:hypothetical protein